MKEKKKDITLTTIVCGLWTLYIPFSYYYSYGFVTFFIFFFFLLIALPLTVWLAIRLIKRIKTKEAYPYYLLATSLLLLVFNTFYSSDLIEKLDWQYQYSERVAIIEKVREGKIKAVDGRVKSNSFPPISNGGNEVFVSITPTGEVEATFYIDRGFLDHYSAFVYTERQADINAYERNIKEGSTSKRVERMAKNWYRVQD